MRASHKHFAAARLFSRQTPSDALAKLLSISESPINRAQESSHFILPGVNAWAGEMPFFWKPNSIIGFFSLQFFFLEYAADAEVSRLGDSGAFDAISISEENEGDANAISD